MTLCLHPSFLLISSAVLGFLPGVQQSWEDSSIFWNNSGIKWVTNQLNQLAEHGRFQNFQIYSNNHVWFTGFILNRHPIMIHSLNLFPKKRKPWKPVTDLDFSVRSLGKKWPAHNPSLPVPTRIIPDLKNARMENTQKRSKQSFIQWKYLKHQHHNKRVFTNQSNFWAYIGSIPNVWKKRSRWF